MNQLPDNAGKCQCVAFNSDGFITESDNILFNSGRLMGQSLQKVVPFIGSIFKRLQGLSEGDAPLYFPRIRLSLEGYSGTCDLFITRVKRATGELFVLFVYDYTMHYDRPFTQSRPRQIDTGASLDGFVEPEG